MAESGYKDVKVDGWFGLFAPARTPKETVARLAGWFAAALLEAGREAEARIQGLYPVGMCGADFADLHPQPI